MPALTLAEQTALRGILRDTQQRWARVGLRPYQFGAEGADLKFNGSILEMAMMPGLISVPEISDPNSPTPVMQGPRPQVVRYRRRTWRAGVRYLDELELDDRIGYYRRLVRGLSEALEYSLELLYHEPFIRALDNTYVGGWDRKHLLDTTHLLLGSGTYNNKRAYVAPTDTVLEDIQLYFDTTPDPYGRPVPVSRIMLFTSQKLFYKFKQILQARTAIINPVTSGAVNPNPNIPSVVETERFVLVGSPYLNQINNGDVYFALGAGHNLFLAKAFSRERMFKKDDPPSTQHEVWWSGNVGWFDATQVLGYIGS
jgi:hypothetical protein